MSTRKYTRFGMKPNPRTGTEARRKLNGHKEFLEALETKLRDAGVSNEEIIADLVRAYMRKLSTRRALLAFDIQTEDLKTLHFSPMFGTEAAEQSPLRRIRMRQAKDQLTKTETA